jgi:hypothetical protein
MLVMFLKPLILLVLIFTQFNNAFWGSNKSNPLKCMKDNAGIHDFNSKELEELIVSQSSLNQQDICGNTAVMYAAALEDMVRLKLLIKTRANVNLQNSEGNTALHISIILNKQLSIKTLIEANANPNVQNNDGNTPLHLAVIIKDLRLISYLIAHGARVAIKNHAGKTPYDLALSLDDSTIAEVIESFNHMGAKTTLALYNPKVLLFTGLAGFGIYLLIYFSWRQVQAYNQKNIQIVRADGHAIPGTGIISSRANPLPTKQASALPTAIIDDAQNHPTPTHAVNALTNTVINDAQSTPTPTFAANVPPAIINAAQSNPTSIHLANALPTVDYAQLPDPIPNYQGNTRESWGDQIKSKLVDSLFNGIGQGIAFMARRIVEKAEAGDPDAKEIMQQGGQLLTQVGLEDTLNAKKLS